MGLLQGLFGRRQTERSLLARLADKLGSFMRPSLSLVDPRDLQIPERRQRLAYFAYGAAHALAASRDLDETRALAVLVMFLQAMETPRLHDQEVSTLVATCVGQGATDEATPVVAAGYQALETWLEGDAGTAVGRLAEVLSRDTSP